MIFENTKTGYSAYVPDLPGCIATGKNKSDVEKRIYEAITFHLSGLKGSNIKIPSPSAESAVLMINS